MLETTLVNKENKIKDKFLQKVNLLEIENIEGKKIKIEEKTYNAYLKLYKLLKKKNIEIGIDSAYRSIDEQKEIIDEFLNKYGEECVNKYTAPIKTSEHHTGLAIDLSIKVEGKFLLENKDLINNESLFLEIHKFLKDFGFILRYPKGKENITGYPYEPWHIRYVGIVPATIMYENNLTLEEYLTNYSGVLVVNKEKNMTSRDVVNEVNKILGIKKIGHTGTLDPLAEGVLVLTIGKATKLGEVLTASLKEYIATVEVGFLTDTLDNTGNILKEKKCDREIKYKELFQKFTKTYQQEVPIYSAVKVDGKKLYEYAREKKEVSLPKKEVTIKKLKLLQQTENSFKFQTLVSKGTYIRSLIRDMGEEIDEYFTMTDLIRTRQGDFKINDSYTLEQIKNNEFKIISIEEVLKKYQTIIIEKDLLKKVSNGVKIKNKWNIDDKVIFKDKENKLFVIYKRDDNYLKIDKMIYNSFNF